MTTLRPTTTGAGVSCDDPTSVPAPSRSVGEPVCSACGGSLRLVDVDMPMKVWAHARQPKMVHQAVVMGAAQRRRLMRGAQ